MSSESIPQKMRTASYKLLDDQFYFGEIPDIKGVWAHTITLDDCRQELREVLESWSVVKLKEDVG